jgi:hypothetical protein
MSTKVVRWALLTAAISAVGCGSDAPHADMIAMPLSDKCKGDTRAPAFSAGIEFPGTNHVTVKLLSSDPAPPKLGDNTWLVEIDDPSGAPIDDAQFTIDTWMPDHGHADPVPIKSMPQGQGQYQLKPVNFNMLGYWTDTFNIEKDALSDHPIVKVCISP